LSIDIELCNENKLETCLSIDSYTYEYESFFYLPRRLDGLRLKLLVRATLAGISRSLMGAGKTIGRLFTPNGAFVACTPRPGILLGISGTIGVLIAWGPPR
jgi:hypothetical protein